MAALTQSRFSPGYTTLKNVPLPIASGTKVFLGGIACLDTSAHLATNAAAGNANLIPVGEWLENTDNTAGPSTIYAMCNLTNEVTIRWYDSDTGGNAVTSGNLYSNVYLLDDHTVTTSSSGNSIAGRVWAVDPVKGVGVRTAAQ